MSLSRPALSARRAGLLLTLYLVALTNLPLWGAVLEHTETHGVFVLAAMVCVLFAGLLLVLHLLASRWLLKTVGAVMILVASVYWYFMAHYGVLVDEDMIANIFETNPDEAGALITAPLILHLLVFGVLPAALLVSARLHVDGAWTELRRRGAQVLGSWALAALVAAPVLDEAGFVVAGHHELKSMVNPIVPMASFVSYVWQRYGPEVDARFDAIATDAARSPAPSPRPTLMVLVLGETATAGHFSLNGYARQTNPELSQEAIVNFSDVHSCGTSTATSVPCMFSAMRRDDFSRDKARAEENLLDVLQRLGIAVLWRNNNAGCKGVCDRVPYEDLTQACDESLRWGQVHCFDEVLLSGMQAYIDSQSGDAFVVLHQQGSHGPIYSKEAPAAFKHFLPECDELDLLACAPEAVVNAYDNTIVYTDHVLALLIELLAANSAARDTAMLYISDHGESLGEDGIFLHGMPYWLAPEEQTHVPMVFWASDGFYASRRLDRLALEASSARPYSHDHVFHSVLGLWDIESAAYDPALDVFAGSRLR